MKASRRRSKRWSPTCRLRGLLIASALATLTIWLLGEQTRRHVRAVWATRLAGGYVQFNDDYRPLPRPAAPRSSRLASWLKAHLPDELGSVVSVIDLDGQPITDDDLGDLAGLDHLLRLHLNATRVTDAGLVHLRDLPALESLELRETKIGDAGLVHLARLQRLNTLHLSYTRVTDAGLAHLAGLESLETLNLAHTAVTDAGLADLANLRKLSVLYLGGTRVTAQGRLALKRMYPALTIVD